MAVGALTAGGLTVATILKWIAAGAAAGGGATIADWLMDEAKKADIDKMGENTLLENLAGKEIKVEGASPNEYTPITKDSNYEAAKNNTALDDYEINLGKNSLALKQLNQESANKTTNKDNNDKEKEPIPPISGMDSFLPGDSSNGQEGIQDTTDLNLGTNNMTPLDWMSWAEEQQRKQWEREDRIRRETQEREDTAWQRGVDDMLRSGINPNLVGAQPAESGGGITQATGVDTSALTSQMNIDLEEMQQIIDNAFKGNENEKDRFVEVFGKIMSYVGLLMLTKGGKK